MDFPMVARDELIDQTASFTSNTSSFSSIGGTLRRSLRQINPFKTRLFRLPATPRLARAKKGLSRDGEETTKWNFERPLSTCAGTASVGRQNGSQMYASIMSNSKPLESSIVSDSLSMTVPADSPAHLRHLKPPGDVGGSCRIRTNRHTRPPLPSYNPPNAREAEDMIHEHIQNLMVSSPRPLQRQFLLSYAPNGDLYDSNFKRDGRYRNDLAPSSPTHSTVSLLNTGRQNARSMSYGARDEPTHKPQYQLNGLFHQPSLRSLVPSNELTNLMNSNNVETVNNQLLFSFNEFAPDNTEVVFLGREWVFKELHQTVISEKTPISMVRGASGSGKSAIMRQLALHSPFYSNKQNNADTVDSGIVIGSQSSAESTLSSRNYEWLRMLGREVCAYHECHLYSANTCSIPEFVRNIATHFLAAPSLRSYSNLINSNPKLMELVNNEASSLFHSPTDLFRQLIIEPLCKIDEEKPLDCIVIVVDAVEEAEFHRNENGESIAWLIKTCHKELPKCVRWILSASNENLPIAVADARSIWIDDLELDERVARDLRLIVDYRIAVNPSLGRCLRERRNPPSNLGLSEFVEEIVKRAKGNALYISILMDMIEQERIQIRTTALSLLPSDLSQLYLLYFNCVFNSLQQFHTASTILSIVLASLRPLTFEQLYQIINSTQTESQIPIKELEKRLLILQPFIAKLNSGAYVLIHNSLREFVLNGSNHTDYLVNVRYGHILHALYFVSQSNELSTENLFELAHHLLKANPHKYLPSEFNMAPNMPRDRDSQVKWLQIAAGNRIQLSLSCERKNIYYPNSKVTRLLLMAGASANATFPDNDTLLCKYATAGNNILIQLLIQYGADPNSTNKSNGMTPLMLAIKNRHKDSVQLLLQCGVKLDAKDFEDKTALIHAASVNLELFSMIFENEWTNESNNKLEEIKLAFQAAVEANNIELCQYILDKTDILDLSTSLLIACCSGSVEVVQLLLSHGATLSLDQKWKDKSALLCVIQSGHSGLTKTLLDDPNLKINTEVSDQGWTPLIVAARYGHNGLIDELINKGCFIDSGDLNNVSAIGHAILTEHFAIANMLIKRGCNIMLNDNEGNTLLHFLALHYNKLLVETLLQLGLQVDTKNANGLRAVEVAIMSDNKSSAEIFLRRGARLRSVTWLIASKYNPNYIVSLIKKLFDDGRTLYKRNRTSEALQRFNHALQKCNEFLQEEGNARFVSMNTSTKSIDSVNNNSNNTSLASIRPQLRYFNCEILYTLADIHRQNSGYNEALSLSAEALRYADSEAALFQLHFFRARCFFDNRDLKNAYTAAQISYSIRPDKEVQVLLDALTSPLEF